MGEIFTDPYDKNAIRAEIHGLTVGYVAKVVAGALSPLMDKVRCRGYVLAGIIRGGGTQDSVIRCTRLGQ